MVTTVKTMVEMVTKGQPVCTEPSRVPSTVLKTSHALTLEASPKRQEAETISYAQRKSELTEAKSGAHGNAAVKYMRM